MTIAEYVAARIKEFRQGYGVEGLSQEALANALGVATNTISRWETGTYKPSLEDLERLARFFRKPITDFLPQQAETTEKDEQVAALLRTAKDLEPNDLDELRRYAEFRRARSLYGGERPKPGRKRKVSE